MKVGHSLAPTPPPTNYTTLYKSYKSLKDQLVVEDSIRPMHGSEGLKVFEGVEIFEGFEITEDFEGSGDLQD